MIVHLDNGNTTFKSEADIEFDIKASSSNEEFEIDFRPVLGFYQFRMDQSCYSYEVKSFSITGMIMPNVPFEPERMELDLQSGKLFITI